MISILWRLSMRKSVKIILGVTVTLVFSFTALTALVVLGAVVENPPTSLALDQIITDEDQNPCWTLYQQGQELGPWDGPNQKQLHEVAKKMDELDCSYRTDWLTPEIKEQINPNIKVWTVPERTKVELPSNLTDAQLECWEYHKDFALSDRWKGTDSELEKRLMDMFDRMTELDCGRITDWVTPQMWDNIRN